MKYEHDVDEYKDTMRQLDAQIEGELQKHKKEKVPALNQLRPDPVVNYQPMNTWMDNSFNERRTPSRQSDVTSKSSSSTPTMPPSPYRSQLEDAQRKNNKLESTLEQLKDELDQHKKTISALMKDINGNDSGYGVGYNNNNTNNSYGNNDSYAGKSYNDNRQPNAPPVSAAGRAPYRSAMPNITKPNNNSNSTAQPTSNSQLVPQAPPPKRSEIMGQVDTQAEMDEYWGVPKAPEIVKKLSKGQKWTDPDFKTDNKSLGKDYGKIKWLRASEVYSNPALFVGPNGKNGVAEASAGDVVQGSLGDCWLLSAMSIVGTRPDIMSNLVVSTFPEYGIYEFRFWKNGEWVTVCIDDFLPCESGFGIGKPQPLFAKSLDPGELWVSLLEKAYAKLMGNYTLLEGGYTRYALVDFTAGAAEWIAVSTSNGEGAEMIRDGTMLRKLRQVKAEGWLMGCSFKETAKGVVGKSGETGGSQGLIAGHAYALLDIRQVKNTYLLRIRNPWGKGEWKGAWSDGSKEWTPAVKKDLGYEFGNDGTFWMSYEDWCKEVEDVDICRTYQNALGTPYYHVRQNYEGPVSRKSCTTQFIFQASADSTVWFDLYQEDWRFSKQTSKPCPFLTCFKIYKVTSAQAYEKNPYLVSSTAFAQPIRVFVWDRRSEGLELPVRKDEFYLIAPMVMNEGEGFLSLTVYCPASFQLKPITEQDKKFNWITAVYTPKSPHTENSGLELTSDEFRKAPDEKVYAIPRQKSMKAVRPVQHEEEEAVEEATHIRTEDLVEQKSKHVKHHLHEVAHFVQDCKEVRLLTYFDSVLGNFLQMMKHTKEGKFEDLLPDSSSSSEEEEKAKRKAAGEAKRKSYRCRSKIKRQQQNFALVSRKNDNIESTEYNNDNNGSGSGRRSSDERGNNSNTYGGEAANVSDNDRPVRREERRRSADRPFTQNDVPPPQQQQYQQQQRSDGYGGGYSSGGGGYGANAPIASNYATANGSNGNNNGNNRPAGGYSGGANPSRANVQPPASIRAGGGIRVAKDLAPVQGTRDIVQQVRERILAVGGKNGFRSCSRILQIMDENGNKQLTSEELKDGLNTYGVYPTDNEMQLLMRVFDRDNSGQVNITEFLRTLRGPMSPQRRALVLKAFALLDYNCDGKVTFQDLLALYDTSHHPEVKSGVKSAHDVLTEFARSWNKDGDDVIGQSEFEDYYSDISAGIDDDTYFELMLRNAWHISGGEGQAQNTSCRRVLVIHTDGSESVEEIKNDLGISGTDTAKIKQRLQLQGVTDIAEIRLAF